MSIAESCHHGLYGSIGSIEMEIFDPHILKSVQPILTKLETCNYLPKTTQHARPHIAASTWVVCANTQFATVSFFPRLFYFFLDSFSTRPSRTSGPICTKIGM